jgi:hypothetical protein
MKEKVPLGKPFIGEPRGGRAAALVAIAPLLCPKGVVVPLNPYFHHPLHLAPIMLTPLTKSIKSKANSIHPFPKFYLLLLF